MQPAVDERPTNWTAVYHAILVQYIVSYLLPGTWYFRNVAQSVPGMIYDEFQPRAVQKAAFFFPQHICSFPTRNMKPTFIFGTTDYRAFLS